MGWTFGICSVPGNEKILNESIDSIETEYQSNYEILVCGSVNLNRPNVKVIDFQEIPGKGWITRKKNILVDQAKYDKVCLLHDYYSLMKGFREGFETFGEEWEISMCKIFNSDGMSRYRDLCCWDDPRHGKPWVQVEPWCQDGLYTEGTAFLPPYEYYDQRYIYISGGFYIGKRGFFQRYRFDETLFWGNAEDIAFVRMWRNNPLERFRMNVNSAAKLLKPKDVILREVNII